MKHPKIFPSFPDPIKIMERFRPEMIGAFAPKVPPLLTYRGGPLLKNVNVLPIYWGAQWQNHDMTDKIDAFYDTVLPHPQFLNQIQEYSVPNYPIGPGQRSDSFIITDPAPWSFTFDFQIRNMLKKQIANEFLLSPTSDTLYVVYTPPGTRVIMGFGMSCLSFCGYHNSINNQIFYAVISYPDRSERIKGRKIS